jgi:hypothetical protein
MFRVTPDSEQIAAEEDCGAAEVVKKRSATYIGRIYGHIGCIYIYIYIYDYMGMYIKAYQLTA